jgi:hypothetical protein
MIGSVPIAATGSAVVKVVGLPGVALVIVNLRPKVMLKYESTDFFKFVQFGSGVALVALAFISDKSAGESTRRGWAPLGGFSSTAGGGHCNAPAPDTHVVPAAL